MDEKKKMFILLGIVGIIILFIAIGSVIEDNKSKSYLKEFYSDLNGNENSLIMIGRDNCSWCQLFKPTLDYMSDKYDFDFTYVNTNELTNSAFNKMLQANQAKISNVAEHLEDLQFIRREIEKERKKLQTEKLEYKNIK